MVKLLNWLFLAILDLKKSHSRPKQRHRQRVNILPHINIDTDPIGKPKARQRSQHMLIIKKHNYTIMCIHTLKKQNTQKLISKSHTQKKIHKK